MCGVTMSFNDMRFFGYAFLCALLVFGGAESANAQTAGGITIIPAFIEEAADPGNERTYTLTVTNTSAEDKEYFIYTRDIKGVEGGGVPIFADPEEEKTNFEMTEWLSLPSDRISVQAGDSAEIPVTMRVPGDASPGSHFSGVFISVEPPKLRQTGAGVGYEVASVISIRISGDISDAARIRSFSTDKLIYGNGNVHFTTRVENQGNILIRPIGSITLTGMFGGDPQVFTVNESRSGVFPGAGRDFELEQEIDGFAFGRYEALVALSYDGENGQKSLDASLVFWVFPFKIMLSIFSAFAFIVIAGYLLTRYYINQAIMRAAGGRRIASQRTRRRGGMSRALFVFIAILVSFALFLLLALVLLA